MFLNICIHTQFNLNKLLFRPTYIIYIVNKNASYYSVSLLWRYCVPRPYWATALLIGLDPRKGVSATNVNHWNRLQWRQSDNCCCCRGALRLRHIVAFVLGMCVISPRPDQRNAWVHGSFSDALFDRGALTRCYTAVLWYVCVIYH